MITVDNIKPTHSLHGPLNDSHFYLGLENEFINDTSPINRCIFKLLIVYYISIVSANKLLFIFKLRLNLTNDKSFCFTAFSNLKVNYKSRINHNYTDHNFVNSNEKPESKASLFYCCVNTSSSVLFSCVNTCVLS